MKTMTRTALTDKDRQEVRTAFVVPLFRFYTFDKVWVPQRTV